MAWITPITDRNKSDVDYAKTHADSVEDNKGAFNCSDLNRIEGNCEYIRQELNKYGYVIFITTKTDWSMTDFPYKSELDRIRSNIEKLIDAYYELEGSPAMEFTTSLSWEDANSLEKNLKNLKIILDRMINGFRYCGTFACGQELILP